VEQSAKNPYYYVMYAYARAHSILAKAASKDLKPGSKIGILNAGESALVKHMSKLPELMRKWRPIMVCTADILWLGFSTDVSGILESVRIIDLPNQRPKRSCTLCNDS
jgi:hypothetical protein